MKYGYLVEHYESEGHIFWVAKSETLKGCVGQGDTQDEAIAELAESEADWLETAQEYGIPIPEVPIKPLMLPSGKVTLRISPYEHEEAIVNAKKQSISLNQYLSDAVTYYNAKNSERSVTLKSTASSNTRSSSRKKKIAPI